MKKVIQLLVVLMCVPFVTFSQVIFSTNETSKELTAYTDGSANDTIFKFCNPGAIASLSADASTLGGTAPYSFTWSRYFSIDHRFSSTPYQVDNAVMSSSISGLPTGGYRVIIKDALNATVATDIAWVWNIDLTVDAGTVAAGCADFSLAGTVNANGTNSFVYYNPPPESVIIDASTSITVCFEATHTWVSDLAFHLVGPPSCGSPDILLSPNPGSNGQGNICNSGNDVVALCFTTSPAANLNVCAGAPFTLTGTYSSYGATPTPINWAPLIGCDASADGWTVQIYDCVAGDLGTFLDAAILISNGASSVNYTSTGSAAILDGTCSSATASSYTVIDTDTLPHTLTNVTTVNWTSNPPTAITNPTTLTPTVSPNPTVDTWFYLNVDGNYGCPKVDSVFFDYTPPIAPVIDAVTVTPICSNGSAFNLTATPTGGAWSGTGITDAVNGVFNPTTAGSGTHTITYNVGGCSGSTTVDITVAPAATVAAVSNYTVCAGQTQAAIPFVPSPGSSLVSWTNTDASIGIGATGNGDIASFTSVNPSNTTPVVATIVVTADNGGCIGASTTFSITINPIPLANAGIDTAFCAGGSVGLLATGGGTYDWLPATNISNSTIANPTVNPAAPISYSLTVTNGFGCIDTEAVFVNVRALPVVNAGTNSFVCPGSAITPAAISVTGASPFVYAWTPAGTISDPTIMAPAFTPTVSPTQYTLTATDVFGCTANDVVTINIRTLPVVNAVAQRPTICPGDSTMLLATPVGAPFPVSYTWTPTGSVDSPNTQNTNTDNSVSGSTTYTVSFTTSVANGACVGTSTVTVNMFTLPTASAGTDVNICPAGTAVLNGTGGGTYLWLPSASLDNATLQTPTSSASVLTQYTLTVTDGNGCKDTASVWAFPRPNPVSGVIDSTLNGCLVPSGSLTVNTPTVGTAPFLYSINGGPTQASNVFTGLAAGNYTLTVTDAYGCSGSDDANVIQALPPVVGTIDSTAAGCTAANGTLTMNTPTGSAPFAYALNGGTPQISNVFSGLAVGNYTITVIDANGCSASDDASVLQALPPVAGQVDSTATGCTVSNGSVTMQAPTGGLAPYSYVLNGGASQASPIFTGLGVGTYTITVTDANGCTAFDEASVIQQDAPVMNGLTATTAICTAANGSINVTIPTGGTLPYTYSVNGGAGQASPVLTSLVTGSYTVTVTDASGCVDSDVITVPQQLDVITLDSAQINSTVCGATPSGSIILSPDSVHGGTSPYTYSNNGGTTFQASTTFSNLASANYPIIVKDANGCLSTGISLFVGANITANAAFTTTPISGPYPLDVTLLNTSTGATNYIWDFGNGGATSTAFNPPVQTYTVAGIYVISLTAYNNDPACASTTYYGITVFDPPVLTIPNIITPNGDGLNDEFKLSGSNFKHLDITIFDRWGREVTSFEGDINTAVWKPTGVSAGTYFCTIKATSLDESKTDFTGFIQILDPK